MNRLVVLVTEIRERRLFKVLVSYLVGGLSLLGIIDLFTDHEVLPEVAWALAFRWFLVGIAACLVVGWHHGEKGRQKAPPSEVAALAVLAIIAAGVSVTPVSRHFSGILQAEAGAAALDLRRVGVSYFRSDGEELRHLADGLTENLISELSRVQGLDVVSRNGVAGFRGTNVPPDSIGRALEAGTLVEGDVERLSGDRMRISVRLLDGNSGAVFRRAGFELPSEQLLAARDSVVQETARLLREWLGDEVRVKRTREGTRSSAVWALFQRAEKARKDAEALRHHGDLHGMARKFAEADTLLARAEGMDPAWAEPAVLRAHVAYRQSRYATEPHAAVRWVRTGMEHAERALSAAPGHAAALEVRGTLRYWNWLMRTTPDPREHQALLAAARQDLEKAVRKDPSLASAHSVLAHLYYNVDQVTQAVLAARTAYEEDAYLEFADVVLWRLFSGLYDLQEFTEAQRWCEEGGRRFPRDHRFTLCRLMAMTTPAAEPKVELAWALVARVDTLAPPDRRKAEGALARLFAGGVLARAGLPDSARQVLGSTHLRAGYEVDPTRDLRLVEAHMQTLLGDQDRAISILEEYSVGNPRASFEHYWWWHPLRANPRFAQLRGAQPHGGEGHGHGH